MKKFVNCLILLILHPFYTTIAFVKEHYNLSRQERLKGYITSPVSKVQALAVMAKDWMYSMFSRQYVDSYIVG